MPQSIIYTQEEISIDQLNKVDAKTVFAAVHIATITGNMTLFKGLQEKNVDLTLCSFHGYTLFYYAVKYQRYEFIELFKKLNLPLMPDKDKLTYPCKTPAHAAIENNDIKLLTEILDYAATTKSSSCIRWHDDLNHPPAITAIINENISAMKLFLERGIWPTSKEIEDALDVAKIPDRAKRKRIYSAMAIAFQEHFAKLNPKQVLSPTKHVLPPAVQM